MDDERRTEPDPDEREGRVSGWLQRHAELVWYALGVVFVVYGATAVTNLGRGIAGPDDANWISTFGGFIAGIAGIILGVRTQREKKRSPDED